MISDKIWPGVEMMAFGDQDLLDVLQSVDNDARQRSQPEADYRTIVKLNKVAEGLVRQVVASENMKRAQNRPRLRSRWVQQSGRHFAVVQLLRRLRSDVIHQDQDQGHQSDGEQEGRCGADGNHSSAQSQISSPRTIFLLPFRHFLSLSATMREDVFWRFLSASPPGHVWVAIPGSGHVDFDGWAASVVLAETILRLQRRAVPRSLSQKVSTSACVDSPPEAALDVISPP